MAEVASADPSTIRQPLCHPFACLWPRRRLHRDKLARCFQQIRCWRMMEEAARSRGGTSDVILDNGFSHSVCDMDQCGSSSSDHSPGTATSTDHRHVEYHVRHPGGSWRHYGKRADRSDRHPCAPGNLADTLTLAMTHALWRRTVGCSLV